MSNILITICARGGSKGCPGKHTRLMAGKPLIEWTVNIAKQWQRGQDWENWAEPLPQYIVLSTDSTAIRSIIANQVLVIDQKPQPTDTTPKVPAIRNAVLDYEDYLAAPRPYAVSDGPPKFDTIIDLDATAPLRTLDDIDGCLAEFNQGGWDCVLSATVGVGRDPRFNFVRMTPKGLQVWDNSTGKHVTRQDAQRDEIGYSPNSSIYVYRREFLLHEDVTSPLDGQCGVYVMPDESFYHVDSELDFKIVEFLMKERHNV